MLGDVADPKVAEALAAAALAQFGRIDILVNNAALRREKPIADMSYAEWREVMDVTLNSAFHCVKACLPALRKNGGAIVNIGGMSAHIGSNHRAHVMTAKAGLVGFTRGLAHDLAADRIGVNCVVPGAIDTPRPQSCRSRRTISPTAPSPASAAPPTTSQRWCISSARRRRISSPARPSTPMAARIWGRELLSFRDGAERGRKSGIQTDRHCADNPESPVMSGRRTRAEGHKQVQR